MPSACFRFLHSDIADVRFFISGGIDAEKARKLFRTASRSRRPMIRFEPEDFFQYFLRELLRVGAPVKVERRKRKAELTFSIDVDDKNIPHIRIASPDSLLYSGPFYPWLGNSEHIERHKRGRKTNAEREARRLAFQQAEEQSPEKRGRDSHLAPALRHLHREHKIEMERRYNIGEARRTRGKVRKVIKANYTTPPNKQPTLLGADEPIPFYGKPGTKRD